MKRFLYYFGLNLKIGTLVCTLGFAGCVLLQIFARLLLPAAPSWTEEAARLFFILSIGCAAGLALRSDQFVYFDFFYQRMNTSWQKRLGILINLLTVILFVVFTIYAIGFTLMGLNESSPSLQFPMAIPFAGMLVLGFSVSVYAFDRLRKIVLKNSTR